MLKPLLNDEDLNEIKENIAYKKAFCKDGNEVIVALDISNSNREGLGWRDNLAYKVSKAKVLGIYDMWGYLTALEKTYSLHDRSFSYEVGKTYEVSLEKGGGIYVWLTFARARSYWLNDKVHEYDKRYEQFK